MKRRTYILFIVLELILGTVFGSFGAYIVMSIRKPTDMMTDLVVGFLFYSLFTIVGIIIPGYFYTRKHEQHKKFWKGIGITAFGIFTGAILVVVINKSDIFPYRMTSFYIPMLVPVLCGILGFNYGVRD